MENVVQVMMDLLAQEVCDRAFDRGQCVLTDKDLTELYRLSKTHDLAHLVGDALIRNGLIADGEIKEKFENQAILAVYRYQKINYELNRLREILNKAQIPFIPLKGSVIRQYYPEPWMRTSCDIDILVREEQVDRAAQVIADRLQYTCGKKNYHDISLMSESGVHLELHYSIMENQENVDMILKTCWSHAISVGRNGDECYEYQFDDAFFLFHQYAHASYHFLHGGCGIRPFADIYLLEKKLSPDRTALDKMLEKAGIRKFANEMSGLADVWFGNGQSDGVMRQMEQYILTGGVYGNRENAMAVSQQSEKGRLGYIVRHIWLPFDALCTLYPNLRWRKYLLPFYEIKRWLRIFNPNSRRRKKEDLQAIGNLSAERKDSVNKMLKELDLL